MFVRLLTFALLALHVQAKLSTKPQRNKLWFRKNKDPKQEPISLGGVREIIMWENSGFVPLLFLMKLPNSRPTSRVAPLAAMKLEAKEIGGWDVRGAASTPLAEMLGHSMHTFAPILATSIPHRPQQIDEHHRQQSVFVADPCWL